MGMVVGAKKWIERDPAAARQRRGPRAQGERRRLARVINPKMEVMTDCCARGAPQRETRALLGAPRAPTSGSLHCLVAAFVADPW